MTDRFTASADAAATVDDKCLSSVYESAYKAPKLRKTEVSSASNKPERGSASDAIPVQVDGSSSQNSETFRKDRNYGQDDKPLRESINGAEFVQAVPLRYKRDMLRVADLQIDNLLRPLRVIQSNYAGRKKRRGFRPIQEDGPPQTPVSMPSEEAGPGLLGYKEETLSPTSMKEASFLEMKPEGFSPPTVSTAPGLTSPAEALKAVTEETPSPNYPVGLCTSNDSSPAENDIDSSPTEDEDHMLPISEQDLCADYLKRIQDAVEKGDDHIVAPNIATAEVILTDPTCVELLAEHNIRINIGSDDEDSAQEDDTLVEVEALEHDTTLLNDVPAELPSPETGMSLDGSDISCPLKNNEQELEDETCLHPADMMLEKPEPDTLRVGTMEADESDEPMSVEKKPSGTNDAENTDSATASENSSTGVVEDNDNIDNLDQKTAADDAVEHRKMSSSSEEPQCSSPNMAPNLNTPPVSCVQQQFEPAPEEASTELVEPEMTDEAPIQYEEPPIDDITDSNPPRFEVGEDDQTSAAHVDQDAPQQFSEIDPSMVVPIATEAEDEKPPCTAPTEKQFSNSESASEDLHDETESVGSFAMETVLPVHAKTDLPLTSLAGAPIDVGVEPQIRSMEQPAESVTREMQEHRPTENDVPSQVVEMLVSPEAADTYTTNDTPQSQISSCDNVSKDTSEEGVPTDTKSDAISETRELDLETKSDGRLFTAKLAEDDVPEEDDIALNSEHHEMQLKTRDSDDCLMKFPDEPQADESSLGEIMEDDIAYDYDVDKVQESDLDFSQQSTHSLHSETKCSAAHSLNGDDAQQEANKTRQVSENSLNATAPLLPTEGADSKISQRDSDTSALPQTPFLPLGQQTGNVEEKANNDELQQLSKTDGRSETDYEMNEEVPDTNTASLVPLSLSPVDNTVHTKRRSSEDLQKELAPTETELSAQPQGSSTLESVVKKDSEVLPSFELREEVNSTFSDKSNISAPQPARLVSSSQVSDLELNKEPSQTDFDMDDDIHDNQHKSATNFEGNNEELVASKSPATMDEELDEEASDETEALEPNKSSLVSAQAADHYAETGPETDLERLDTQYEPNATTEDVDIKDSESVATFDSKKQESDGGATEESLIGEELLPSTYSQQASDPKVPRVVEGDLDLALTAAPEQDTPGGASNQADGNDDQSACLSQNDEQAIFTPAFNERATAVRELPPTPLNEFAQPEDDKKPYTEPEMFDHAPVAAGYEDASPVEKIEEESCEEPYPLRTNEPQGHETTLKDDAVSLPLLETILLQETLPTTTGGEEEAPLSSVVPDDVKDVVFRPSTSSFEEEGEEDSTALYPPELAQIRPQEQTADQDQEPLQPCVLDLSNQLSGPVPTADETKLQSHSSDLCENEDKVQLGELCLSEKAGSDCIEIAPSALTDSLEAAVLIPGFATITTIETDILPDPHNERRRQHPRHDSLDDFERISLSSASDVSDEIDSEPKPTSVHRFPDERELSEKSEDHVNNAHPETKKRSYSSVSPFEEKSTLGNAGDMPEVTAVEGVADTLVHHQSPPKQQDRRPSQDRHRVYSRYPAEVPELSDVDNNTSSPIEAPTTPLEANRHESPVTTATTLHISPKDDTPEDSFDLQREPSFVESESPRTESEADLDLKLDVSHTDSAGLSEQPSMISKSYSDGERLGAENNDSRLNDIPLNTHLPDALPLPPHKSCSDISIDSDHLMDSVHSKEELIKKQGHENDSVSECSEPRKISATATNKETVDAELEDERPLVAQSESNEESQPSVVQDEQDIESIYKSEHEESRLSEEDNRSLSDVLNPQSADRPIEDLFSGDSLPAVPSVTTECDINDKALIQRDQSSLSMEIGSTTSHAEAPASPTVERTFSQTYDSEPDDKNDRDEVEVVMSESQETNPDDSQNRDFPGGSPAEEGFSESEKAALDKPAEIDQMSASSRTAEPSDVELFYPQVQEDSTPQISEAFKPTAEEPLQETNSRQHDESMLGDFEDTMEKSVTESDQFSTPGDAWSPGDDLKDPFEKPERRPTEQCSVLSVGGGIPVEQSQPIVPTMTSMFETREIRKTVTIEPVYDDAPDEEPKTTITETVTRRKRKKNELGQDVWENIEEIVKTAGGLGDTLSCSREVSLVLQAELPNNNDQLIKKDEGLNASVQTIIQTRYLSDESSDVDDSMSDASEASVTLSQTQLKSEATDRKPLSSEITTEPFLGIRNGSDASDRGCDDFDWEDHIPDYVAALEDRQLLQLWGVNDVSQPQRSPGSPRRTFDTTNPEKTICLRVIQMLNQGKSQAQVSSFQLAKTHASFIQIYYIGSNRASPTGPTSVFRCFIPHGANWSSQPSAHQLLLCAAAISGAPIHRDLPVSDLSRKRLDTRYSASKLQTIMRQLISRINFRALGSGIRGIWWRVGDTGIVGDGCLVIQNWETGQMQIVPAGGKSVWDACQSVGKAVRRLFDLESDGKMFEYDHRIHPVLGDYAIDPASLPVDAMWSTYANDVITFETATSLVSSWATHDGFEKASPTPHVVRLPTKRTGFFLECQYLISVTKGSRHTAPSADGHIPLQLDLRVIGKDALQATTKTFHKMTVEIPNPATGRQLRLLYLQTLWFILKLIHFQESQIVASPTARGSQSGF